MATAAPKPSDLVWVVQQRVVAHSGHGDVATEMTRAEAEAAKYVKVFDAYVQEERYVPLNFLDAKKRFDRFDRLTYDGEGRPEYSAPKPVRN